MPWLTSDFVPVTGGWPLAWVGANQTAEIGWIPRPSPVAVASVVTRVLGGWWCWCRSAPWLLLPFFGCAGPGGRLVPARRCSPGGRCYRCGDLYARLRAWGALRLAGRRAFQLPLHRDGRWPRWHGGPSR